MPPLTAGLLQATTFVKAVGNRVVGAPTFAAALAGSRVDKKLRLRVLVLRDEDGEPVAREDDVRPSLAEASRVLEREGGVRLVAAGATIVETLAEPAPAEALEPRCAEQGLWRADLGPAGGFFRRRAVRNAAGAVTGYGAPITAFVVRDVRGKGGCSLGPLGDYLVIDAGGLGDPTRRILAHELGHSCGLAHSERSDNLMRPTAPGERLTRFQAALVRSSRHVTYL